MGSDAEKTDWAGDQPPGNSEIARMIRWFDEHAAPGVEAALADTPKSAA